VSVAGRWQPVCCPARQREDQGDEEKKTTRHRSGSDLEVGPTIATDAAAPPMGQRPSAWQRIELDLLLRRQSVRIAVYHLVRLSLKPLQLGAYTSNFARCSGVGS